MNCILLTWKQSSPLQRKTGRWAFAHLLWIELWGLATVTTCMPINNYFVCYCPVEIMNTRLHAITGNLGHVPQIAAVRVRALNVCK